VDGTLLELAPTPDAVRVRPETHDLVHALHAATGGAVALVSGRAIADVDVLFPGIALPIAGQHGLERRDAAGATTRLPVRAESRARARQRLAELAARHAGLLLEDKGMSLALHYRAAPQHEALVHDVVRGAAAALGHEWLVQRGKMVVELRPSGVDKGAAIAAYLAGAPFSGRVPVFLGDDVTDEHGFEEVNRLGGHSIKVGDGASAARWRLRDVPAVERWLGELLAAGT
jgi:trehalose 6-phosphate phosphatase